MTCKEPGPWPEARPVKPLVDSLESVDPVLVKLSNRLHQRRQAWLGELAGQALAVEWASPGGALQGSREVLLTLGHEPLRLLVPAQPLDELLGDLQGQAPTNGLDPLALTLLTEMALLELIEPIEARLRKSLQVAVRSRLPQHPNFVVSLTVSIRLGDAPAFPVVLEMTPISAHWVASLLEEHLLKQADALPQLRLKGRIEAGQAPLRLSDLRSLRPGDVVMLDYLPADQLRVTLAERLQARGRSDGSHFCLIEAPQPVPPDMENAMSDADSSASLDSQLDDLPLKLVCQAGSVEVSLAQLRELGAGSLLLLTPQLQDGVELLVNGRKLGQGQLVRIGDGLGVRILSFATP
ncbi:type III secretion system cytoplasmic ring protein SctQ [Pseudomonas gingeri]|uniref:Type III secretion system cytoplasmic ring protein SctQ n=2 Tax=Pseudomonas gingeri TaxID=117681 RepID=A0A7Y7YAE0_9PSED|nr:type III secretion system cytoplasmic ring protein SctQ [Pseudomonas gingeri]NWB26664.1 type III secretion system cytoplasmic ring protein SctQ [Pseudomonas gingeri]NWC32786.1 type III secretion system cytoplasmic ring protein SctQ [Pseudomonas gingeri]NWD07040.1 type III secretion system cytoplasmic ring protein SctQ [Pseudomonas gingeri]NWE31639.1 type III secretion system cytoplasmic ring protein SctQ [Pseudomonas gingeri]NWE57344.1 type III secretion system cytoplasmic ring protein SctQ